MIFRIDSHNIYAILRKVRALAGSEQMALPIQDFDQILGDLSIGSGATTDHYALGSRVHWTMAFTATGECIRPLSIRWRGLLEGDE